MCIVYNIICIYVYIYIYIYPRLYKMLVYELRIHVSLSPSGMNFAVDQFSSPSRIIVQIFYGMSQRNSSAMAASLKEASRVKAIGWSPHVSANTPRTLILEHTMHVCVGVWDGLQARPTLPGVDRIAAIATARPIHNSQESTPLTLQPFASTCVVGTACFVHLGRSSVGRPV